jgi:hypothetical protein
MTSSFRAAPHGFYAPVLVRDMPKRFLCCGATSRMTNAALIDRYVRAWEGADLDGFVSLLKEDATYAMPPWRQWWYRGRDAIRAFFSVSALKLYVKPLGPGMFADLGLPLIRSDSHR